jgi:hypothetical protein
MRSKTGFVGIGTAAQKFGGTFDGNGFTITLAINTAIESNVGLFRYTNGAIVKNLTIAGTVKAVGNVGSIIGNAANTTIEHCTNNAVITTTANNTGGLIGNATNTTVSSSRNNAVINGRNYSGGIIGLMNS